MNRLQSLLSIPLVSSVLLLVACGGQAPEAPAPVAEQPEQEPVAAPERVVPPSISDANGMLTLRPGGIDRCTDDDGVIAVEVEWNATAANTDGVHLYLSSPGEEEKLWSTTGAVGTGTTGEWMRDGSVVRLVNAHGDQEIASVTLKDVPCP